MMYILEYFRKKVLDLSLIYFFYTLLILNAETDITLIFDKAAEVIPGSIWEHLSLDIDFYTN